MNEHDELIEAETQLKGYRMNQWAMGVLAVILTSFLGWLGITQGKITETLGELSGNVKVLAEVDRGYKDDLSALSQRISSLGVEVSAIRKEQQARSRSVYDIEGMEARVRQLEKQEAFFDAIRFKTPDMRSWASCTAQRNPEWKPCEVKNHTGY